MMLLGCEEHDEFDPNQQAFGLADNCYKLSHGNKYLGSPYGEHAIHLVKQQQVMLTNIFVTATDLRTYLIYGDAQKSYLKAG